MSVKQYLEEHDTSVLHFSAGGYNETLPEVRSKNTKELSDTDLILEILNTCRFWYSANPTEELETNPGASRSAIDLWRHAKFFHPEISIYDVLHILFNQQNKLKGHHCSTVYRQVFVLAEFNPTWNLNIYDLTEFGNYFSDWENICLENDNAEKNYEEEYVENEDDGYDDSEDY
jgi:hypothetical protein